MVHRPATPRKTQLSNESSSSTDVAGDKESKGNDYDQSMLFSSDMPTSLLVECLLVYQVTLSLLYLKLKHV